MPKSKPRKTGHPARQPTRPTGRPVPTDPEKALSVALLSTLEASLAVVQEAEARLLRDVREGGTGEALRDVHHHIRAAALGLMVAYSKLEGLPDPREKEMA